MNIVEESVLDQISNEMFGIDYNQLDAEKQAMVRNKAKLNRLL